MFFDVITPYGGVDKSGKQNYYVHGGIAFFGGGKNYSMLVSEEPILYGLEHYAVSYMTIFLMLLAEKNSISSCMEQIRYWVRMSN